eukprot:2153024-Pyramimonas_sp.AAC.1
MTQRTVSESLESNSPARSWIVSCFSASSLSHRPSTATLGQFRAVLGRLVSQFDSVGAARALVGSSWATLGGLSGATG